MVRKKSENEEHRKSAREENMHATQDAENNTANPADDTVKDEKEPEKKVAEEELTAKLAEMQDRYLRLSAEFDNYRKRNLREKMEMTKSAGESVILKIIPVIDDFDRALLSMADTNDVNAVKAGIELIYNKFSEFLKQSGVKEIESLKQEFNSDLHEAVTKIPAPDESLKGKVIDVIQKGYSLNDKIIRFPKVVVGE